MMFRIFNLPPNGDNAVASSCRRAARLIFNLQRSGDVHAPEQPARVAVAHSVPSKRTGREERREKKRAARLVQSRPHGSVSWEQKGRESPERPRFSHGKKAKSGVLPERARIAKVLLGPDASRLASERWIPRALARSLACEMLLSARAAWCRGSFAELERRPCA
ncbi:hypothetical protein L209DRAFT_256445 [Thermothelomyces heterothallicus CBS 203.75]